MQLAQDYPALNIVGLGGQDSQADAEQFAESTGIKDTAITVLWDTDPSIASWQSFGVRSQPYWILFGSDGAEITSRPGAVDIDAVEAAL